MFHIKKCMSASLQTELHALKKHGSAPKMENKTHSMMILVVHIYKW